MISGLGIALFAAVLQAEATEPTSHERTLDFLQQELSAHFATLSEQEPPAYYMAYALSEAKGHRWAANGGQLEKHQDIHQRVVDIDMRVGSMELDNHHTQPGVWLRSEHVSLALPLDDDPYASQKLLWRYTDDAYRESTEHLKERNPTVI